MQEPSCQLFGGTLSGVASCAALPCLCDSEAMLSVEELV